VWGLRWVGAAAALSRGPPRLGNDSAAPATAVRCSSERRVMRELSEESEEEGIAPIRSPDMATGL
jgi:hypothetical protein